MKTQTDKTQFRNTPRVGDRCTIRGVPCEIIKIRPLGTIDVAALNPDDSRAFRVSGLAPFQYSHEYIIADSIAV